MPDQKLTREELAAELEARARALRGNKASDEDVEKMSAARCGCCGGCILLSKACWSLHHDCQMSCTTSSPG